MKKIKEILSICLIYLLVFNSSFVSMSLASDTNFELQNYNSDFSIPNLFNAPIFLYPSFSTNFSTKYTLQPNIAESHIDSTSKINKQADAYDHPLFPLILYSLNLSGGEESISQTVNDDYYTLFQSAEIEWKEHRWEDALNNYESITNTASSYASKAHIQIGKYYKYLDNVK